MEDSILGPKRDGLPANSPKNVLIANSWERCFDAGMKRSDKPRSAVLYAHELRSRREENFALWQLAQTELRELFSQVAGSNYVVAFADRSGTILEAIHDQEFSSSSASRMVVAGSVWHEQIRGTNALGLTLATKQASVVDGNEHFLSRLENISCFASPVRNTKNEIVGIIDASTDARSRGRHTLALVNLAAANVENSLFKAENLGALILGFHPRHEYLTTTSAGLLALSEEGFIIGANGSAQEMLRGFDLSDPTLFENIFDIRFSTLLQEVLNRGFTTVKDRMQSTVYFTIKEIGHLMGYISKIHLTAGRSLLHKAIENDENKKTNLASPSPESDCQDAHLLRRLGVLGESLATSGSLVCHGPSGSGKSVICQQLLKRLSPQAPFVEVDCALISDDNYEQLLFGTVGRLGFFEPEYFSTNQTEEMRAALPGSHNMIAPGFLGKLHKAAKGMLYLRNFEIMPEQMANDLLRIVRALEQPSSGRQKFHVLLPKVVVLSSRTGVKELISGDKSWISELIFETTDDLAVPHLNERLDLNYVIRSVTAAVDPEKIVTVEAERLLSKHYWVVGLRTLRKTMRQIVGNCPGKYIRPAQIEPFLKSTECELQPCPSCIDSAIKRDKCLTIRKAWRESQGNISLVSRKLGLSRTTIYAHLKNAEK